MRDGIVYTQPMNNFFPPQGNRFGSLVHTRANAAEGAVFAGEMQSFLQGKNR